MVPVATISRRIGPIMIGRFNPADYSVAVKLNRQPRNSWRWEINRPGKCYSVERSQVYFQTVAEATRAEKRHSNS
jgi:hypothetical protein